MQILIALLKILFSISKDVGRIIFIAYELKSIAHYKKPKSMLDLQGATSSYETNISIKIRNTKLIRKKVKSQKY